jgi:hypothetical protein
MPDMRAAFSGLPLASLSAFLVREITVTGLENFVSQLK